MIWPVASVWVAHISHTLGEKTCNEKYSEINGIEEPVLCAVSLVSVPLFISRRWISSATGVTKHIYSQREYNRCPNLLEIRGEPSIGHGCTHAHPIILANEIEVSR